ncbi:MULTISPECIES: Hsp20/alpha crystallin family protein [Lysobacter]|uniref:Hsp20/alpha crystallin family protein n=1 Tax=Lysobacter soli TaxID=453783 RepID=A0A3D8VED6_9GAMM|nr:Hsp20/alpha crystallin family protein [Lysobacter soli]RDY67772.1 Hsp20/alpha crystallin family protein [Lysobacter soli]UTA55115.1 Hsp20/alpha crystallin family protein [Lysobacter soli]
MNEMVRNPQWPAQGSMKDPVKQIFDRLFEGSLFQNTADESSVVTSQWVPRVDIKEEADRFLLYADIPGVDPQDIEVQMDKGLLTIKGERREEKVHETERYSRIERRHGVFHRRFALPDSADPDGITASGHNGVLTISIPKRPESTPRRIQVGAVLNS